MIADLLAMADELASYGAKRPWQAYLRRSVSGAYYALFHALAKLCADELIGVTKANTLPWVRVYRALDHAFAKNALNQNIIQALDPAAKGSFGNNCSIENREIAWHSESRTLIDSVIPGRVLRRSLMLLLRFKRSDTLPTTTRSLFLSGEEPPVATFNKRELRSPRWMVLTPNNDASWLPWFRSRAVLKRSR